ncbi:uncharacterized protein isoform X4 [Salmo salar]|uniref:Uncharacterized protein isoform X4 n=1 Tax=Salmo salar TaxID=8030 RepID=A0ABM3F3F9_SALSA|nr:uncharacterized protein LOC106609103 isoform X4 [Salmo salar]
MVWPLRTHKTNWMRLLKRQNALLKSSTQRRTHKPNWTRPKRLAEELNPERENKKKKRNKPPGIRFRWRQRDEKGQIVPQTRKATTSTSVAPRASTSRARLVQHFGLVTEEEELETRTSGLESTPVLNIDEEIAILHRKINILLADLKDPECSNPAVPGASHSWSVRKELSQDRWRESRPEIVDSLLAAEHASQKICQSCNVKMAILRCRDCLPKQLYCEDCDLSIHAKFPLHNRQSMIEGFYTPLPPTTAISLHSDGKYALHEQDCFLPLDVPEVICGCLTSTFHVGPGKHIILIGINGLYNVTVPVLTCTTCLSTWTANLADLIKNGYWPATVNCDTIYQNEMICGDTFQKSFFEWTYCRSEIDQD